MTPYTLDEFFTDEQIEVALNSKTTTEVLVGDDDEPQNVKTPSATKKKGRKRKVEEVLESMLDVMTKIHDDTSDHLQTLSSRIGYDFDLSAKRVEISKMLDDIPLLPKKHRFLALDILVKEPERLDLFTGFSLTDKHDYILHILEEKHGI
ncbi:uncharacterized protein LOC121768100 isoform X1 [Salvia splendens]|nr:uncharacterized protein LOC121768100 isoform X1 [Salvia splendens]XP_042020396.1 uncharacterized protein LOC121768100 isoform X1 [Salvia splendens]